MGIKIAVNNPITSILNNKQQLKNIHDGLCKLCFFLYMIAWALVEIRCFIKPAGCENLGLLGGYPIYSYTDKLKMMAVILSSIFGMLFSYGNQLKKSMICLSIIVALFLNEKIFLFF